MYSKLHPPPETPEDELCSCDGNKPIKLMYALSYNPLCCIDCNLQVVPETLALNLRLVEAIASWRDVMGAIDHLWLDSGAYEAWAKQQLSTIASPVNQQGLVVCKELDAIRRCYYWYFQDESSEDYEPITHCPNCQQELVGYSNGIFRQLLCEQCSIITVG